tara:strand:+ start:1231 stop:2313 length:1083 start_codon:yes stop_codon:yes gene_type:complete
MNIYYNQNAKLNGILIQSCLKPEETAKIIFFLPNCFYILDTYCNYSNDIKYIQLEEIKGKYGNINIYLFSKFIISENFTNTLNLPYYNINSLFNNLPIYNIALNQRIDIINKYITLNNYITNEKEYIHFLKNKKIALIGPSETVFSEKINEDDFDIIIRVNKMWGSIISNDTDYTGKRCDILYNNIDFKNDSGGTIDFDYLCKNKTKFIISTIKYDYNNFEDPDTLYHDDLVLKFFFNFHLSNKNKIKFIPFNSQKYNYIRSKINTRPNCGFIAIKHLLDLDFKKLYIKGFSFSTTPTINSYKTKYDFYKLKNITNHDHNSQFLFFKKLLNTYSHKEIILDPYLNELIKYDNLPNTYIDI